MAKKAEGRGQRTIQVIHLVLHSILSQAVKEGILSRNPADAVERPRVEQVERQILTEEQARELVQVTTGTRHGMLIYLALMTGMREGELLGLKWSDVDWSKGQLHVQRQLQRTTGSGASLVPPKTKAGKRQIKLGQATLVRLAKHRQEQAQQKENCAARWEENDLIFPNTIGKPMSWRNMYREYKLILSQNGLPDISFHDLRHTSLSFLLDLGTPINTVQQRAGHSKASITTDTYGHSLTHAENEAADRLEELFKPDAVKSRST